MTRVTLTFTHFFSLTNTHTLSLSHTPSSTLSLFPTPPQAHSLSFSYESSLSLFLICTIYPSTILFSILTQFLRKTRTVIFLQPEISMTSLQATWLSGRRCHPKLDTRWFDGIGPLENKSRVQQALKCCMWKNKRSRVFTDTGVTSTLWVNVDKTKRLVGQRPISLPIIGLATSRRL